MRRFVFWFYLFTCFVPVLRAEPPATDTATVKAHYVALLERDEYRQPGTPDFSSQIGHWLIHALQSLQDSFDQYGYSPQLIRLSYALMWSILFFAGAALIYWLVKLLQWRHSFQELTLEKPLGRSCLVPPESFEPEIRQAVTAQRWAAALHLSWCRFLCQLERHDFVLPDRTRTNWEYLEQLRSHSLPAAEFDLCRELARIYDRHVYGGRAFSREDWIRWSAAVETLARLLQLNARPKAPLLK